MRRILHKLRHKQIAIGAGCWCRGQRPVGTLYFRSRMYRTFINELDEQEGGISDDFIFGLGCWGNSSVDY